ncbi:MAG: hypothetical protein K5874_07065 [Bacteroidaceae bacterium]|nr:hypothetical protein [Bacteroidaceae bacterium]
MQQSIITIMLVFFTIFESNAHNTESFQSTESSSLDSIIMDSSYNYWNNYVKQHPNDEKAWLKLFEQSEDMVRNLLDKTRSYHEPQKLRAQLNVVGRMEQAIPKTYTFYYCAYEGGYEPHTEDIDNRFEYPEIPTLFTHRDEYADSAIAVLPNNATADDYECWIPYLIDKQDTLRLHKMLRSYYESGLYPEEMLQYHFNELQGMDEGGIYIGYASHDIIGKLILQEVLGVHKDKILYNEDQLMDREYVIDLFRKIGIPIDEKFEENPLFLWQQSQIKTLELFMRYLFDNSTRPIYLSAHNMKHLFLGTGVPDDLQASIYNEGLTMRYSPRPYNNKAVKRRNIEQRYRLEYLRMSFHPAKEDQSHFQTSLDAYAANYIRLLHDQLPYYKQHNYERYQWLKSTFMDIVSQLEKKNYDVNELKHYLR